MKQFILFLFFLGCFNSYSQSDTMIAYYDNGQLKKIIPKLDGKAHGKSKMWYESGQLWSEGVWENGKQIKTIMYHENGNKSYYVLYKKWKLKIKMWHPNGQLWTHSNVKYSRSIEKEFDSTGLLMHKIIERKGSSMSCIESIDSAPSDSVSYADGSCMCSWGNAYFRNGIWVDEKGRDLSTNYTYVKTEYYSSGKKKKETIWSTELKKYLVREWDEKGNLLSENTL